MTRSVKLDGNTITISEVIAVASGKAKLELSKDAWNRVINARKVVDSVLESGDVVYGINTGFGSLVDTLIDDEQLHELQLNLIRSHATGLGEPMEHLAVKVMMVARINSFAKGYSGVTPNVVPVSYTHLTLPTR